MPDYNMLITVTKCVLLKLFLQKFRPQIFLSQLCQNCDVTIVNDKKKIVNLCESNKQLNLA